LLSAIDRGVLKPGDRVMYLLTGGFRRTKRPHAAAVEPDVQVTREGTLEQWADRLGETFEVRPVPNKRAFDRLFS
jgi:hypothetical protein